MSAATFTKNYRDRSTDSGFQFEFFCDGGYGQWMPNWLSYYFPESCGYSYISTLQPYPLGIANKVKDVSNWLKNRFPTIGPAGDAINTIHKDAWENAFNNALREAQRQFKQCPICTKWVCKQSCFNVSAGTCKTCANIGLGALAKKPNGKTSNMITCKHCGDTTENGKFCATCGKPTSMNIFCGACGKQIEGDRRFKFCPHCGDSLSYLDDIYKHREESA